MLQIQPLEITDFSAGITDHVYEADRKKSNILDNFVLLPDKTPQTRPGSQIDTDAPANDQIPDGDQRIALLINYDLNTVLFVQSGTKMFYRDPSAYSTLIGPTSNNLFSVGDTTNTPSYTQWNKHIFITSDAFPTPQKIYQDENGDNQLRSSGLPDLGASPVVTKGLAGANNYNYAFHYEYSYRVGSNGETFIDKGPVTVVAVASSGAPQTNNNSITFPTLANGGTDNYDTATVTITVYRTINAGNVYYKLGSHTNGGGAFTDSFSDTTIALNETIYTADGSVENDPPPKSKFIHVVNGCGYYGYLSESSEERKFTVRQSIQNDPDSVPTTFEDDVEDEITGLSSVKNVPIVLCKRHIYRIDGQFDQFGAGGMIHTRIADTAGCVSSLSCVQAEDGLFWAGNDGFYFTDGYIVKKISDGLEVRYAAMIAACDNPERIIGKFDEVNRRVIWGVQTEGGSNDNDSCWVLDLRYGVRPDSTFTTWNADVMSDSFAPSALEIFNGLLYRADKRGYIFIHNTAYSSDPTVDITANAEDWTSEAVIYKYKSIAFNGGSTFKRKMATRLLLTARNVTNISIQINAINDDGRVTRELKEIRWRRNFTWGNEEFFWGDPTCIWASSGLIEQWRRMPAGGLRWSYIQIEVTNSNTIINNSDTLGNATFSNVAHTAVLNNASFVWPTDCVGYSLTSEVDGYEREFPITARTDTTLTVTDALSVLPTGSIQWEIKGYRKGEILNLLGLNLHWALLSPSQMTYETGQDGANA